MKLGIFANFAANGSFTNNRNMQMVANKGWPKAIDMKIKPILDEYPVDHIMWHLPGGRNDHPMDFDGFQEILEDVSTGQDRWMALHPWCFQGAMIDLHHRYQNLRSMMYVGAMPKDADLKDAKFSEWYARVQAELKIYTDLPFKVDFGFDLMTGVSIDKDPLVGEGDKEFEVIDELESKGHQCYMEPHPRNGQYHYFDHGSGFVVKDTLWVDSPRRNREETQQKMWEKNIPVHLILSSFDKTYTDGETLWEKVKDDEAIEVYYIPYARFETFITFLEASR